MTTEEITYINDIQEDSPIIFLEKATDGKVTVEDISKALDEYKRLFKAGFSTPAELLTLSRAYPENNAYSKALEKMGVGDDDSLVIGGPASIEMVDREGHLITLKALEPAFEKYMGNIRNRNVMVLHSDVQVGWALPAYISSEGSVFKSGVDDTGLFFIAELRNDTKVSQKVREQITSGQMKSYSIAGSALKTQTVEKGMLKVMQVDELELAEVTICEKGVNQEAGFDILKGDDVPTKSCSDGSCLTKMQECDCQNATPEVEPEPIVHKPMQLLTKSDGTTDYSMSLNKWLTNNKHTINVKEYIKISKEYSSMKKGKTLLSLAVEVLKALPSGAVYADSNTPADAIQPNESGRGRGHWFPAQYAAANKEKEKSSDINEEQDALSEEKLNTLRSKMADVRGINPSSPTYNKLRDNIEQYSNQNLKLLANAKINFISSQAKNTLRIRIKEAQGTDASGSEPFKADGKPKKGEKPKADSPKQKEPSAYPSGSPQEFKDFGDYVRSFYGKDGIYNLGVSDKDIDNAINEYIEELRTDSQQTWGSGDSVDRERVRDILIRNFKNKK